jgi:hypothetical protein
MGIRKIVIDVNHPETFDEAVRKYDELCKQLDQKTKQFMQELAKVGADAAKAAYGSAVDVTAEPFGDDEWVIRASGEAVIFLEFGAGDATESGHRYANEMPFDLQPGSWSREHAQQYWANGFWVFGGRKYTEVKPRRGMLEAYQAMMREFPNVAKRVFG